MPHLLQPELLPPNVIEHWYRGGPALAAWRGLAPDSDHTPEDWIASTTHRFGLPGEGLSRLADGTLLAEAISSDPLGWLGGTGGAPGDTGLLVKLLDAGQRLPVHVHPTRGFAAQHLGCRYGKTEAWFILQAEPGALVWAGWNRDVTGEELAELVERQDVERLLASMHAVPVHPGDGILIPGGTPHAIGEGILLVEAQEPTDQSILLEHITTTATPAEIFLGLSLATALSCVTTRRLDDVRRLVRHAVPGHGTVSVLPAEADPYFRMHLFREGRNRIEPGFAVAVVLDGAGHLSCQNDPGGPAAMARGQAWVVPAVAGHWTVTGDVSLLVCRPGTDWPLPG